MQNLILRKAWLLSVLWAAAVLVLTLMPGNDVPTWPWAVRVHLDKFVHAFLFGIQCVLLGVALTGVKPGRHPGPWILAALVAVAFGGVIELLQQAMGAGRHGDVLDLLADSVGALLGALLGYRGLRQRGLTRSSPPPPSR